jgi:hypothetical protein
MPRRTYTSAKDTSTSHHPSFYHTSPFSLSIKPSLIPNAGEGVFTNDFIPSNTIIDEYYGDVHYISFSSSRYFLEITPTCGIDAFNYPRCYMAMINDVHGTDHKTNCTFIIDQENERAFIKSTKDISSNSEIYVSYGDNYWTAQDH